MPHAVPVIRSASLNGYVELATSLGLHPMAMMRKAGLSPRCLEDPETPISVVAVRQLLEGDGGPGGAGHDVGALVRRALAALTASR